MTGTSAPGFCSGEQPLDGPERTSCWDRGWRPEEPGAGEHSKEGGAAPETGGGNLSGGGGKEYGRMVAGGTG